jgi:pyruvate/2-oxoglutarate dehydrogenase complex dihydrolipoamide acyltransferase (E2) component
MAAQEIRVPDIGDFRDVPVIEVHVAPGDTVAVEDPLLTLESDKATLDVPSPVAGTVGELRVSVGDTVSEGTVVGTVETSGPAATPPKERLREGAHPTSGESASYGSDAGVYDRLEVTVPTLRRGRLVSVVDLREKWMRQLGTSNFRNHERCLFGSCVLWTTSARLGPTSDPEPSTGFRRHLKTSLIRLSGLRLALDLALPLDDVRPRVLRPTSPGIRPPPRTA